MSDRPIDILKCSLMPRVWHKTRYIVSTLKLKNDTGTAKYLLPITARLEIHGELIARATPSAESPGSHKGPSWGTTYEKGNVVQAGLCLNDKVTRELFCCFEIHAMALNSLVSAFQANNTVRYRLELELGLFEQVPIKVPQDDTNGSWTPAKQEIAAKPPEGILVCAEDDLNAHEWQEWMNAWGAAGEAIYLPVGIANELRAIKPVLGVGFEWEVISELLKSYCGTKAETILVTSESDLESKMTQVIADAKKELLIMCRALDEILLESIFRARDSGVAVKIIAVPSGRLRQEKYQEMQRVEAAWEKVSQKVEAKQNKNQHARIIISESAAIVGSTDPDYYGLKVHKNASVYTTNVTVVNAAKLFFDKVWQES